MIIQYKNESRKDYLLRAAIEFIRQNPIKDYLVSYDDAECDGACLMEDIVSELSFPSNKIKPIKPKATLT